MEKNTLILWLLTILCWGFSPILEKLGLKKVDPLIALFIRTFTALLSISFFLLFTGTYQQIKDISFKAFFIIGLSGILAGFLGMYFYFSLLKLHPASQIVPLTATYPLIASILAIMFLKEPVTLSKLLGIFLIVLGIYLLLKNP
ncbi:MAG: EamA family transporter [Caldimicrobium sp.]